MIRRQVDQYTDIRFQTGHQINLKRGEFKNINMVLHRRPHQEYCRANIPAHVHIACRCLEDVPYQRRGGGFAIGSGNGHDARARTHNFPLEHFRVANDFNAGGFSFHHGPMRLRMGERNTWTQDKTIKRGKINPKQI